MLTHTHSSCHPLTHAESLVRSLAVSACTTTRCALPAAQRPLPRGQPVLLLRTWLTCVVVWLTRPMTRDSFTPAFHLGCSSICWQETGCMRHTLPGAGSKCRAVAAGLAGWQVRQTLAGQANPFGALCEHCLKGREHCQGGLGRPLPGEPRSRWSCCRCGPSPTPVA